MTTRTLLLACIAVLALTPAQAPARPLQPMDVFDLQWAADPQISPDGRRVAYVRFHGDVMKDVYAGDLWLVGSDGREHRPLVSGAGSPRWSPDGTRLAYVATDKGASQIFVRWMDTGRNRAGDPRAVPAVALAWSPDGPLAGVRHAGARGDRAAREAAGEAGRGRVAARAEGRREARVPRRRRGLLKDTRNHVFVVPRDGGTPRQLTEGPFDHDGPLAWTPDGQHLLIAAEPARRRRVRSANSELHAIRVADGTLRTLTSRKGPITRRRCRPTDATWPTSASRTPTRATKTHA